MTRHTRHDIHGTTYMARHTWHDIHDTTYMARHSYTTYLHVIVQLVGLDLLYLVSAGTVETLLSVVHTLLSLYLSVTLITLGQSCAHAWATCLHCRCHQRILVRLQVNELNTNLNRHVLLQSLISSKSAPNTDSSVYWTVPSGVCFPCWQRWSSIPRKDISSSHVQKNMRVVQEVDHVNHTQL